MSHVEVEKEDYDMYRDGPVRYLGYANELGESFRPLIPRSIVWGTYGVASLYVLADTNDKAQRAQVLCDKLQMQGSQRNFVVSSTALDTLTWQGLASVCIPGFTIYKVVEAADRVKYTQFAKALPKTVSNLLPTLIGLATIPWIVEPIDFSVHTLMN
eukprot:g81558.t1